MCSVVEITSEQEYYIYYHSPESLETVPPASAQPSLEYQHLFQLGRTSEAEDTDTEPASVSDSRDSYGISRQKESLISHTSGDKDFSVEEIVTPQNEISCASATPAESAATDMNIPSYGDSETADKIVAEEVSNDNDRGEAVDNDLDVDNELNCEKAVDKVEAAAPDQMSPGNGFHHVSVHVIDWSIKGWKTICFVISLVTRVSFYENMSLFFHKNLNNFVFSCIML